MHHLLLLKSVDFVAVVVIAPIKLRMSVVCCCRCIVFYVVVVFSVMSRQRVCCATKTAVFLFLTFYPIIC